MINLRDLLEEQILTAGEDVLSVEYKGNVTYATLSPEGHIICNVRINASSCISALLFAKS